MASAQKKPTTNKSSTEEQADQEVPLGAERTEGIDEDVDGILDIIDEVLESNAEDFVKAYVQKGGQ